MPPGQQAAGRRLRRRGGSRGPQTSGGGGASLWRPHPPSAPPRQQPRPLPLPECCRQRRGSAARCGPGSGGGGNEGGSRTGGASASPVRQGLRLLRCSLFPFAKVGVAGMSPLLRRGAEPCPLERGDVSIKKTQKGEVSKNKTLHPLQALAVPEAGAKVLGAACGTPELAGGTTALLRLFLLPRGRSAAPVPIPGPDGQQVLAEPRGEMGQ